MKRSIIKTRPQRPYLIARIVLIVLIAALLALVAYAGLARRARPAHAALQDSTLTAAKSQIRLLVDPAGRAAAQPAPQVLEATRPCA